MQKKTLDNGLRVITAPMKGTKTVTVLVMVGTGSKYETKNVNGISHFLEHMFFKGTKKRPNTLAISESLDSVGGVFNAFTGEEYTGYYAKVDMSHLDLALDVISDMYLNSKFASVEIEREKGVIVGEINMCKDMPMEYVWIIFNELLYGDQPAGWSIAGTEKVVRGFNRKHFVNYLNSHYTAKNTIVCVAGAIDSSNVEKKVKEYFTKMREDGHLEPVKTVERQSKPEIITINKKTDQTHLVCGVRAYDRFHKDKYALKLLATILGGNMSSRLFLNLRERNGLGYYVRTEVDTANDVGVLVTSTGVDNSKVEKAVKIILDEYKKIKNKKVSEQELKNAKEYIKGKTLIGLEASDAMANFACAQELLSGEILTTEEIFAKINKVTVSDIQRVARDIFVPAKLNLAMIGPIGNKKKFEKVLEI